MKFPYYKKVTDKVEYADSKMFRVRINPEYQDNAGLIAHEEKHIEQWYTFFLPLAILAVCSWFLYREDVGLCLAVLSFTLKDLLYTFVAKFRLWAEVKAHKSQMDAINSTNYDYYAGLIANNYNIDINKEEVVKLLKG